MGTPPGSTEARRSSLPGLSGKRSAPAISGSVKVTQESANDRLQHTPSRPTK